MIRHRLLLQFDSLMYDPARGRERIAIGLIAASMILTPMSAFPSANLWPAIFLLLPPRGT